MRGVRRGAFGERQCCCGGGVSCVICAAARGFKWSPEGLELALTWWSEDELDRVVLGNREDCVVARVGWCSVLPGFLPVFAPSGLGESLVRISSLRFVLRASQWLFQFAPGKLVFACPKKSNQKKRHPGCPPNRCASRRWRGSTNGPSMGRRGRARSIAHPCGLVPPAAAMLGVDKRGLGIPTAEQPDPWCPVKIACNGFSCIDLSSGNELSDVPSWSPPFGAPSTAALGGTSPQGRGSEPRVACQRRDALSGDLRPARGAPGTAPVGAAFFWLLFCCCRQKSDSPARDGAKTGRKPGRTKHMPTRVTTRPACVPKRSQSTAEQPSTHPSVSSRNRRQENRSNGTPSSNTPLGNEPQNDRSPTRRNTADQTP